MNPLYYLSTKGNVTGPFAIEQIQGMWKSGSITADAVACLAGTEDWRGIAEIVKPSSDFKAPGELTLIGKIGVPLFALIALPALAVGQLFIGVPLLLLSGITYCKARS